MASTNDTAPRSFARRSSAPFRRNASSSFPAPRCAECAVDRADRVRLHVRRRLPVAGARYGVPDIGPRGLRRYRGGGTRHHRGVGRSGAGRHRRRLRRRQERRAHRCRPTSAWARARCSWKVRPGPSVAATWREEGRAGRDHGSEDQGHHGRAPRCGDADLRARPDARRKLGFDEALRRAERYVKAGAEAIFVEAPESIAELECLAKSFDVPQFANPLVGGRTPILSIKEFEQLGIQCDLLRARDHHARGQGDEDRARGHARRHLCPSR